MEPGGNSGLPHPAQAKPTTAGTAIKGPKADDVPTAWCNGRPYSVIKSVTKAPPPILISADTKPTKDA